MGVQDNPRCIGNWVREGVGGAINLIERLTLEGYEWGEEEQLEIEKHALRLLAIVDVPGNPRVADLQHEIDLLRAELTKYEARVGTLT